MTARDNFRSGKVGKYRVLNDILDDSVNGGIKTIKIASKLQSNLTHKIIENYISNIDNSIKSRVECHYNINVEDKETCK